MLEQFTDMPTRGGHPSGLQNRQGGAALHLDGSIPSPLRRAKGQYTIVRPGSLTDDSGTGQVEIGERLDGGSISRDDVAAVVAAALHAPSAANRTFDVVAGETPVDQAIASL